jgi:hypothetical protein
MDSKPTSPLSRRFPDRTDVGKVEEVLRENQSGIPFIPLPGEKQESSGYDLTAFLNLAKDVVGAFVGTVTPSMLLLAFVDRLFIQEEEEELEVFEGFEDKVKYSVKNSIGQRLYFSVGDAEFGKRNVSGGLKAFNVRVFDFTLTEVIRLHRPATCNPLCCPCTLHAFEVSSPPDTHIGTIEQEMNFSGPVFSVRDGKGKNIFRIKGPFGSLLRRTQGEFVIMSPAGGGEVGKIKGIAKDDSTLPEDGFPRNADISGVTFPMELDVQMKALMLGALFLIDYVYLG